MIKEIVFMLGMLYIFAYCCIYTSYLTYNTLDSIGLEPEYKTRKMIGTPYYHAYVECEGFDLFLNPFREYGEVKDSIPPNESNQWGSFFNPITKNFIKVF